MIYRVSSPRLGLEHGQWSGESPMEALAAMLTASGYPARAERIAHTQTALFGEPVRERWCVVVEPDAADRMARLGLELRAFRVEELEPIPMGLFTEERSVS